jgi:RNA polymerase sigma-70 factor (ECF subfamily)
MTLPPGAVRPGQDDLVARLREDGPRRDDALRELHALLLRAARFEVGRRAAAVARVRGEDADALALQAADDAFVAVLAKLDDFRGDSRFTTWAYKFALYEAAVRVRRRAWQEREVVLDADRWLELGDRDAAGPHRRAEEAELLTAVRQAIATALTPHRREVLVALAVDGVPIDVLAERLGTTRGALYKTLHDARRALRRALHDAGHDLDEDRT